MDLLSTIDGRSIELNVLTYSRFRAAQEQVKKHGDVLLLGKVRELSVVGTWNCSDENYSLRNYS